MTSYTNNIVDFRFIALAEDHVLADWLRDDRICYDGRNGQTVRRPIVGRRNVIRHVDNSDWQDYRIRRIKKIDRYYDAVLREGIGDLD